jgi:hypothetical protein
MKLVFALALGGIGLIVAVGIFPPAKTHLDGFIDDVIPGLGFSGTLSAYVSLLPYILLALLVICCIYYVVWARR